MNFEEALSLMKKGKKITHPYFEPDEYFMVCYVSLMFAEEPEDNKLKALSIVKMKGNRQHPDMMSGSIDDPLPKDWDKRCKHGNAPQLNLFLVMSDDWEVFD